MNKERFLPKCDFQIQTDKTVQEVLSIVRKNVEPESFGSVLGVKGRDKPFIGKMDANTFKMHYNVGSSTKRVGRKKYYGIVSGMVVDGGESAIVKVHMEVERLGRIITDILLGFYFLLLLLVLYGLVCWTGAVDIGYYVGGVVFLLLVMLITYGGMLEGFLLDVDKVKIAFQSVLL